MIFFVYKKLKDFDEILKGGYCEHIGQIPRSMQGQGKINVRFKQRNHNHNHNYNLMGF